MAIGTGTAIGLGLSALGGLLGNKQKSTTTPTLDKAYGPLQGMILNLVQRRLQTDPDLSGYQAQGMSTINRNYDLVKQAQANNLTARGLGTSPVAGAVDASRENARVGEISSFANSIPILRRQQQAQDLGLAGDVLSLGRGSSTEASGGGGFAGGATNLAQMIGYLMGTGAFKRGAPAAAPAWSDNMATWG